MAEMEGQTLGRYELETLMGRGGMADVYLAYDPRFEREVAIKLFRREDEDLLRRFIREAQLMASLNNAHLIPVYDAGTSRLDGVNVYYIVMPYMEGGTLRSRVRRNPLPLSDACRYLTAIAGALDYIHSQGIIHRDIKSSNVLLDADGDCYLSDFGIARATTESTQLTTTGNVLGTVDYMAPELFEGDTKADERSDFYALGVLLYEMVTGRLPFVAESPIAVVTMHVSKRPPSPRQYIPDLPVSVERVIMRALQKNPDARYQSGAEFAQSFCAAVKNPSRVEESSWEESSTVNAPLQAYPEAQMQSAQHPAITRDLQAYSTQNYPSLSGQYPVVPTYAPPVPQRQALHKVPASGGGSGRFLVFLTILALLAVVGSVSYVFIKNRQLTPPVVTASSPTATIGESASAQETQLANGTLTAASARAAVNATATQQGMNANVTATKQAISASATAAANVSATATVAANATATGVAVNATATPAVLVTATSGTPVYQDPLSNANNADTQAAQWDQSTHCAFQSDGYHVTTSMLETTSVCHEAGKTFTDFAAQVDVSIQSGYAAGFLFRMSSGLLGTSKGYLFEIDANGNYKIAVSSDISAGSEQVLQDWTPSAALLKGTSQNDLAIIARGGSLLFYANNTFLASLNDTTYSSGTLGFLALAKDATTEAVYNNLDVYALS